MPLAWPVPHELEGRDCWCGRSGCLEGFLSLGGLENEYFNITQTKLGIQAIADAADASDLVASSVLQVLDDRIGRTTAAIINMFDPDVIILGGRIAELNRLYLNVPRKWPGYLLIEQSKHKAPKSKPRPVCIGKGCSLASGITKCELKIWRGQILKCRYGQSGSSSASNFINLATIVKSP